MIKFDEDPDLGQVVADKKCFCWMSSVKPIKTEEDLQFASGYKNFSYLCGFYFKSSQEVLQKSGQDRFDILFVSKIRSKIYHKKDQSKEAQWQIFKRVKLGHSIVLDKTTLLNAYGFDIDKFFESDFFKLFQDKFVKIIQRGIPDLKRRFGEHNRFVNAIENSIPGIMSTNLNSRQYTLKR